MFYLIMRIKDKKPCSSCRHSNSTIVCLKQGNVIMCLFDEIWVLKWFTLLLISHTRRSICLNSSSFGTSSSSIPKDDKFTSFLEWVVLRSPISCKTNAPHAIDVVLAEAEPRVQIKQHALSHALKSKLCQAGLTLASSRAGRQLLVLTLISTVTPLDEWFLFVCVCVCLCVCKGEREGDKQLDSHLALQGVYIPWRLECNKDKQTVMRWHCACVYLWEREANLHLLSTLWLHFKLHCIGNIFHEKLWTSFQLKESVGKTMNRVTNQPGIEVWRSYFILYSGFCTEKVA